MIKEKYDKINYYLNELMQDDSYEVRYYQDYLIPITCLAENYASAAPDKTKEYLNKIRSELRKNRINNPKSIDEKEKISITEVLDLTKEILATIDKIASTNYVEEFDAMINRGEINIDYDETDFYHNDADDSFYYGTYHIDNDHLGLNRIENNLIQIKPEYNYEDINTLIHEFIHSRNAIPGTTPGRTLLTEAISIFFETYANEYLMAEKGLTPEDVRPFDRVLFCNYKINKLGRIGIELGTFVEAGNLSDESYDYIASRFNTYPKDLYEREINNLYDEIKNYEDDYEHSDDKIADDVPRTEYVINRLKSYFKDIDYILGTIIAYNMTQEENSIIKMVNVNNMIKNEDSFEDIYYNLGVDIVGALDEIRFNSKDKSHINEIGDKFMCELMNITDFYYDEEIEKKYAPMSEEAEQHTR